jgi:tRNA-Thr(GGU) m(6)t(6)A37 methyltransferase TsaA
MLSMSKIIYNSIGIIHTPFKTLENIPIQNTGGQGEMAKIEIFKEYSDGLKDLKDFSHIILLYHLHKVFHSELHVKPFMDHVKHGIFSTRSPVRPNPIGLTVVKLIEINNNILIVENIDMLDQSPLLDIKPYLPLIDDNQDFKLGWLTGKAENFKDIKSDKRFKK